MDESRVALVTGANRGIGLEVCRQLAARGLRVMLTARDLSKAQEAARSVQSSGEIVPVRLDITDPATIRALAGERVDVLVNNAGILVDEDAGILDLSAEDLRATFETNVFAP